jgi:hypothetical protein
MKRSEINEILGHTRQFFSMHDVHLPPFASFPPTKWHQLDHDSWREVFDLKLGWDVTAFGGDNFYTQGSPFSPCAMVRQMAPLTPNAMRKKSCTCATGRSHPCIFTGANAKTLLTVAAAI